MPRLVWCGRAGADVRRQTSSLECPADVLVDLHHGADGDASVTHGLGFPYQSYRQQPLLSLFVGLGQNSHDLPDDQRAFARDSFGDPDPTAERIINRFGIWVRPVTRLLVEPLRSSSGVSSTYDPSS